MITRRAIRPVITPKLRAQYSSCLIVASALFSQSLLALKFYSVMVCKTFFFGF
jgi:hypothetical protein